MDQLIGQVFHDRYRIQSLLGHQKGRRTFLASDLQTGSAVVVKLLLFAPDFTWEDLKLFEREAEVLKSLSHHTVPQYLDCFEVETDIGKGFALVQTYIEARSLQDWVQSGRTFSEDDLKAIATDLLTTLDYLHTRQPPVVHRDIKPSNILLGDRSGNSPGQVYLVDFGSVQTAVHGSTQTIVGTYGYMPMEQFSGQSLPASDLYALGATLIYLATGQAPDQLPQRDMRILFEDRVSLSLNLVNWLKWLTQPSLDRRLQSATQALKALKDPYLRAINVQQPDKPIGSQVKVTNTAQVLEILIPPRGFHVELLPMTGFAIVWNIFLLNWYRMAFLSFWSFGWFAAIFAIVHLGVGLNLIWTILFTLSGKCRLRITESQISLKSEILGLKYLPARTASRQSIVKIERAHQIKVWKSSRGSLSNRRRHVETIHQINIWAGTKKFSLGDRARLTTPELDWLGQELSDWLNLPVTKTDDT